MSHISHLPKIKRAVFVWKFTLHSWEGSCCALRSLICRGCGSSRVSVSVAWSCLAEPLQSSLRVGFAVPRDAWGGPCSGQSAACSASQRYVITPLCLLFENNFLNPKRLRAAFLDSISFTRLTWISGLRPPFRKAATCMSKCTQSHCSVVWPTFRRRGFCSCLSRWPTGWFGGRPRTSLLRRDNYHSSS